MYLSNIQRVRVKNPQGVDTKSIYTIKSVYIDENGNRQEDVLWNVSGGNMGRSSEHSKYSDILTIISNEEPVQSPYYLESGQNATITTSINSNWSNLLSGYYEINSTFNYVCELHQPAWANEVSVADPIWDPGYLIKSLISQKNDPEATIFIKILDKSDDHDEGTKWMDIAFCFGSYQLGSNPDWVPYQLKITEGSSSQWSCKVLDSNNYTNSLLWGDREYQPESVTIGPTNKLYRTAWTAEIEEAVPGWKGSGSTYAVNVTANTLWFYCKDIASYEYSADGWVPARRDISLDARQYDTVEKVTEYLEEEYTDRRDLLGTLIQCTVPHGQAATVEKKFMCYKVSNNRVYVTDISYIDDDHSDTENFIYLQDIPSYRPRSINSSIQRIYQDGSESNIVKKASINFQWTPTNLQNCPILFELNRNITYDLIDKTHAGVGDIVSFRLNSNGL